MSVGGIWFLTTYGLIALRRALRLKAVTISHEHRSYLGGRLAMILTTLAVRLLNPHGYLDTVVILGAIGRQMAGADRI